MSNRVMRVIVRFSIDGEGNSALRNKLASILESAGVVRSKKTGTYEGELSEATLGSAVASFWETVAEHQNQVPGVGIDHFWMYADKH